MKKSANQIADEVIEKVAMPFRSMIKDLTKQIAQGVGGKTVSKAHLKNLKKVLKDLKGDQAVMEETGAMMKQIDKSFPGK